MKDGLIWEASLEPCSSEGKVFLAEGRANAKALRWQFAEQGLGTAEDKCDQLCEEGGSRIRREAGSDKALQAL